MRMRTLLLTAMALGLANAAVATTPPAFEDIEQGLLPGQFLEGQVQTRSIAAAMLEDNIPGVSMTFIDKGEVAWQKTYGHADLATMTPVTADTVFTGASLSKPLAAVTALQLVEQGKLGLDDDVNRHLKSWKVPESDFVDGQAVTLRQLIGHRAGIANYVSQSYDPGEPIPTVTQLLAGGPPSKDPGTRSYAVPGQEYKYSNPGYLIIQQLVEDVSGTSFEAAAHPGVLEAAGMHDSSFAQPMPGRLRERRATGYNDSLSPYPYQLFPFKAAGGVWTTPTDLARFAMTLIDDHHGGRGVLLSRKMTRQVFARDGLKLGFTKHFVDGSDDIVFDHWGSNVGFTSYMVGSLENRQALVIMTNSDKGFDLMAAIARTVARHYGWKPLAPRVYSRHDTRPEALPAFAGEFGGDPGGEEWFAFGVDGDQLYRLGKSEDDKAPLVAVAERTFIDPVGNTLYEFLANRAGEIAWLRVTQASGYNSDYPKRPTLPERIGKSMQETGVEGLAIAVIRDGKIVLDQGFGVTNARTGGEVDRQTLFEAASLSKPVFAYFTLALARQGVLDLDQPLSTYWTHPDLRDDPRHERITARMLLTHTSGLPNWRSETGGKLALSFEPGTAFQYSGEGYEYLRGAIQKQLKLDDAALQALFDEEVTKAVGAGFMKYTWDDAIPARKAYGHRDGVPTDNHRHDHNFGASYSLNTTAGDYARFVVALLRPDNPGKQALADQLFGLQTGLPTKAGEPHRTLGFAVKDTGGRLMYYHSGNNGDFRAYVHFYRDTGDGVVMLSNSDKLVSSGLAEKIAGHLGHDWPHAP
ncbi:MAG TPA: serine hydrolase domain-containing protein [Arenimonas sp.]